ncbi:MFS transporter [Streptococcus cameli]
MKKQNYVPTISSLYINYVFQGIAAIIVSQNMTILREQWQASLSQVTLVLSAIGLGRILSINTAGFLSDKLGRKLAVALGGLSYIIFFLGLLYSPNYQVAFVVSIFAGFGNAFLDTATYPVVVEAFDNPSRNSALSVLNKAFISMGQFVFPIITRFILNNDIYFGWTFLVSAACMLLNLLLVLRLPFPKVSNGRSIQGTKIEQTGTTYQPTGSRFRIEGMALMVFSFISVSLFNVFITWIPTFAQKSLYMKEADSLVMVSAYSIFSFISVFLTSFIVNRGINVPRFMMFCTTITGTALAIMLLVPNYATVFFATFSVGCFAAGGIWQLGLAVLLEFFPFKRGLITSYYSLATSISVMGIPYLTGLLAEKNINYVFILVVILAFVGTTALSIVNKSYQKLVYKQSYS